MILIPVSVGELLDKISILYIKKTKISDVDKLRKVETELEKLRLSAVNLLEDNEVNDLYKQLLDVNFELWKVEDKLRLLESNYKFGDEFVTFARSVYILNDKRFAIKDEINRITNSEIQEVKSYVKYDNRTKEI